jgi:uncharacterized protein with FMN-binding domain
MKGRFAGSVATEHYGAVQATITVTDNKITEVAITAPQDNPTPAAVNRQAVPLLPSETVAAQAASVNTVSGATFTGEAYNQSLQAEISNAKL